jgi:hypothetical protein
MLKLDFTQVFLTKGTCHGVPRKSATPRGHVGLPIQIIAGRERKHRQFSSVRAEGIWHYRAQPRAASCRDIQWHGSFAEKLQVAEKQRDSSERARREIVNELNQKIQDVTRALQHAQTRITQAEERAIASEFRAQAAENQLHKANQELAAVEDAIRKRLL